MKEAIRTGLCFGLTSGIITTLGLIVGLHSGTHSRLVVIGGVLTIAVADAMSDALGMHISKESGLHDDKEVWAVTLTTLFSKFFFALTFLAPLMLLELRIAIVVSIIWGLLLLTVLSYFIAKGQNERARPVMIEHLVIAAIVILITHLVGDWIGTTFV